MIESVKRIREPFTWAVVAVLLAGLVIGLVRIVLDAGSKLPLLAALQASGGDLMNLTVVFALVGLVCTCLFVAPATRNALLVTRVSAVVVSLGVAVSALVDVLGLFGAPDALTVAMDSLGGLLDLVLKAMAAGALWLLARGVSAGRIEPAESVTTAEESVITPGPAAVSWRREDAVGTAWGSAADAASGQPGAPRLQVGSPTSAD
jgi:hypothetical protein